jgi:hypothetical protein
MSQGRVPRKSVGKLVVIKESWGEKGFLLEWLSFIAFGEVRRVDVLEEK